MNSHEDMPARDVESDDAPPARNLGRDLAGLALFAAAIFLGVSVFMSSQRPADAASGSTALVTWAVGLLGFWPLLALSLALVVLGGRLWVAGVVAGLGRNALASLALTLALSVLCGASVGGAGGTFGAILGGSLSGTLSVFVGVPLGLALVCGVVWFAWLRMPLEVAALSAEEPEPSVYASAESEGLTADEAEALLPTSPKKKLSPAALEAAFENLTGSSIAVAPDLPPLYPHDVRREGGIPEGARVLEPRDAPAKPRPAPKPAAERVPAEPEPAAEPVVEPGTEERESSFAALLADSPPAVEPAGGSALPDLAPSLARWERAEVVASAPPVETPRSERAEVLSGEPPVRSAWEAEVDEDEEAEEESTAELAEHAEEEEEEEEEEAEEDDEELAAEYEEDGEEEDEESEEEYEEEEESDEYEEEAEESDEEEEEEEEEDDDELAAELEEADEEEEAEEDVEEEVLALDDESEEVEEELAPLAAAAEDAPARRAGWEQAGLFDDEPVDAYGTPVKLVDTLRQANQATAQRLDEDVDAESDSEAVAELESEPEVVLAPQPAPKAKAKQAAAKKAPAAEPAAPVEQASAEPASDDLVYRAGLLFLERGRVAVSMLQRTFELDFKQATAMLDQLQEAGLIGPYLGGQRRDILLTAEEWRERRVEA